MIYRDMTIWELQHELGKAQREIARRISPIPPEVAWLGDAIRALDKLLPACHHHRAPSTVGAR